MSKKYSSFKKQQLIMENWRIFLSEDDDYENLINYLIENYSSTNKIVLTEGAVEDIKNKVGEVAKQFGRRATMAAMAGLIATSAVAPSIASAADSFTADLPVAAQQMDDNEAEEAAKSKPGEALKKIFKRAGEDIKGAFADIKDKFKGKNAPESEHADTPESTTLQKKLDELGVEEGEVGIGQSELGHEFARTDARMDFNRKITQARGETTTDADGTRRTSFAGSVQNITQLASWRTGGVTYVIIGVGK